MTRLSQTMPGQTIRSVSKVHMSKADIRNILVPIDFSKLSRPAINTAKELARRFEAAVHLVHVHEFYYPTGFIVPAPVSMITYYENAGVRQTQRLKMLARRNGLAAENCHLVTGAPRFSEICNLARMIPADLIVTSTRNHTGITHFFEGSTAERIVQHSPCPVFVARRSEKKSKRVASNGEASSAIDTILVPVDFSHFSFQALEYAIEFAERNAARLIIFHAVHPGETFNADGYGISDLSAVTKAACKDAERQMKEFLRLAKFRRVPFDTAVKAGRPVPEICAFADERDVDLIITATHGYTGFRHLLMGSVAERVVRHARRSVLVVPSHPEVRVERLNMRTRTRPQSSGQTAKSKMSPTSSKRLKKRNRKQLAHQFPERRKTNKFRESHST